AFLHGSLKEDVYVCQPEGFIDADHRSHVYKLKKALYGLKQAPRAWYIQLFSDLMKSGFEMSMMGEMTFFLSLQVNQSPCGIFINQSKYVLEILNKYGMEFCDPIGTPMEIKDKLDLDPNGTPIDATKYRSMIGSLMYLMSSRPDIDSGFDVTGFSNADYAGCKDTFKSTFGRAQFLGEKLLTDYGFHFNKIPIYCDSKSTIPISCNPVQHSRTKHIAVRYHFIKEHVEKGTIELYFVKIDYQLADIFTKALPTNRFNYLVRCLARAGGIYPGTLPLDRVEVQDAPVLRTSKYGESNAIVYSIHTVKRSSQNWRIRRWRYNLTPAESKFKTPMLDHQDKYMMKAQVHVLKSSVISDIQPLPQRKHYCQIYQVVKHMLKGDC
nr:hypothetical protein [Tanacetum cinerariifolium]GEZ29002.1 hypothetical protein [Tanacetum cinerariifolium]